MHPRVLTIRRASLGLLAALAGCERSTAPIALVYADRPVRVPVYAEGWRDVAVGGAHSCGVRIDGRLYCWGSNASGQLGVVEARGQCSRGPRTCEASPRAVATADRFTQVSAGERHSCAVTVGGELRCWGENIQYQTGVEAETYVPTPTAVLAGMRVLQVAAGYTHSCAVRVDGVVYCWGEGRLGALGVGDTLSSVIPRPIRSDQRFSQVSAGRWRSCAIAVDGALWCWGSEWERSVGNTDYFHERLVPHRIEGAPPLRSVSVAGSSICGVTADDALYCWESNSFGQLGIGSEEGTTTPTRAATREPMQTVSAGIIQSCGLARDGRALCWGNDTFGQLGIPRPGEHCGALECRRSPAYVFGEQRFVAVATGAGTHSCGVTTSSAMLCWGLGTEGQLGDGWSRERQSLPVAVLAPSD
ncbi:MAG: bnr repeat-containing protein [Gemmatimonadetes bacterium]|nr:bnr repeat-containing protein [Gemmatimonadota bacterium]